MLVIISYGCLPPQRTWLNIFTMGSMAAHPRFVYRQLYFSLTFLRKSLWGKLLKNNVAYGHGYDCGLSIKSPQFQYNKYHLCNWLCDADAAKAQSLSISAGRGFQSALLHAEGIQDLKTGPGKAVYLVLDSRICCKTVSTISDLKMTGNMLRAGEMVQ